MLDDLVGSVGTEVVTSSPQPYSQTLDPSSLDDLLHQKTRILNVKMAVFASAIIERLRLRTRNQQRIDSDEEQAQALLERADRQARYHLREHQDKRVFYETLFELREERRSQDVECWRDVVDVTRDFLAAWEAHEQARSKAIFLDHAGP